MFSDNHVANAHLAQLPVHVVNKYFRQPRHVQRIGLALFKPQQHKRQNRCHHVEPAIKAVGDLPLYIPMRRAGLSHDLVIQWNKFQLGVGLPVTEQSFQKCHNGAFILTHPAFIWDCILILRLKDAMAKAQV